MIASSPSATNGGRLTAKVSTGSRVSPRSTSCSRRRLFTMTPAVVTSASARAISETTSSRPAERARLAVAPRVAPPCEAAFRSDRNRCSGGQQAGDHTGRDANGGGHRQDPKIHRDRGQAGKVRRGHARRTCGAAPTPARRPRRCRPVRGRRSLRAPGSRAGACRRRATRARRDRARARPIAPAAGWRRSCS